MQVFRLGDGSLLCGECLKEHLNEIGAPNNITCGLETDSDGLPVFGWESGECSQCSVIEDE